MNLIIIMKQKKLNKKRSLLKFQISLDLLAIICQLIDCITQMPL